VRYIEQQSGHSVKMWSESMLNHAPRFVVLVGTLVFVVGQARAEGRPTRFWNLTRSTITELRLAPAGTSDWGPNQCKNDKDGAVESDERLGIPALASGNYDAKLTDATGRVCVVHGLKIEAGAIFTIEEKDLTACKR
jgi:hypothetical protein